MTFNTIQPTQDDQLVLGVARTGAKFTPRNHKNTGNRTFDAIASGDLIPVTYDEIKAEFKALHDMGVGYIHEHARNPDTREQTTSLDVYSQISRIAQEEAPGALLSYGGSRNGPEIAEAIRSDGEIARVAQAGLPRLQGGADFVTTQAAIELQIVLDMERQGFVRFDHDKGTWKMLRPLEDYVPSGSVEKARFSVNSTDGGANYGASSAAIQMETLKWTIDAREQLNGAYEVELVQKGRSLFLTWYLANAMANGIRRLGRLNITILFGFSPRLPFPKTFAEFRKMVKGARAIATPVKGGDDRPLKISISVGAAVLPHHARDHICPVDVGPLRGTMMGPMERLAIYAAQPGSGVDILRVGMEDTPFILDPTGRVLPATNTELVDRARRLLKRHEIALVTDPVDLQRFKAA
ncbi:MAG: 3-keto-5-aminohexanoate cleavage protein [Pseudomonadota bacterium]